MRMRATLADTARHAVHHERQHDFLAIHRTLTARARPIHDIAAPHAQAAQNTQRRAPRHAPDPQLLGVMSERGIAPADQNRAIGDAIDNRKARRMRIAHAMSGRRALLPRLPALVLPGENGSRQFVVRRRDSSKQRNSAFPNEVGIRVVQTHSPKRGKSESASEVDIAERHRTDAFVFLVALLVVFDATKTMIGRRVLTHGGVFGSSGRLRMIALSMGGSGAQRNGNHEAMQNFHDFSPYWRRHSAATVRTIVRCSAPIKPA
ncbi:hypothetical protein PT2222_110352 [Paraburkholderia tropica]